jgi:hypothetical protein
MGQVPGRGFDSGGSALGRVAAGQLDRQRLRQPPPGRRYVVGPTPSSGQSRTHTIPQPIRTALEIGSEGSLTQQDRLTVVPPANFKCNATGCTCSSDQPREPSTYTEDTHTHHRTRTHTGLAGRSFGVALSEGEWQQNGVVNVTLVSDYPAHGVISRPESESGGKWEQKADAYVRVESPSQAVGMHHFAAGGLDLSALRTSCTHGSWASRGLAGPEHGVDSDDRPSCGVCSVDHQRHHR